MSLNKYVFVRMENINYLTANDYFSLLKYNKVLIQSFL